MSLRRLIFAIGFALALFVIGALTAQCASAAWQARFRAVRQERGRALPGGRQAMPRGRQAMRRRQVRRERIQEGRQAVKGKKAANRAAKADGLQRGQNDGFRPFEGKQKAGQFNPARDGAVARPPNQQFFNPNPNVVRRFPPRTIQRLREMSPEQQEHFFENNRRFQQLPPARQAQIRRNLQRWNNLSPAERDQMIHRNQVWQRMSPEQRQMYRDQILPKWQQMSPDRRQLVIGRLHTLQGMTPNQQQKALNDPRFMQGLSPDEQSVLRNLSSLSSERNPQ